MNHQAMPQLLGDKMLKIVLGAGHLFEQLDALEFGANQASD